METQIGTNEGLNIKSNKNKRKQWTKTDDSHLQELVSLKGPTDWPSIAKKLANGKNGKQCRKRWFYKLNPSLRTKIEWAKDEDDLILSMQSALGNHWAAIAKALNGRSDLAVKNRFYCLQSHYNSLSGKKKKSVRNESNASKQQKSKPSKSQSDIPISTKDLSNLPPSQYSELSIQNVSLNSSQYAFNSTNGIIRSANSISSSTITDATEYPVYCRSSLLNINNNNYHCSNNSQDNNLSLSTLFENEDMQFGIYAMEPQGFISFGNNGSGNHITLIGDNHQYYHTHNSSSSSTGNNYQTDSKHQSSSVFGDNKGDNFNNSTIQALQQQYLNWNENSYLSDVI